MAHIVMHVNSFGAHEDGTNCFAGGLCRTSDMEIEEPSVSFYAIFSPSALVVSINNAIRDAAIDAVANATPSHTVGLLDRKIIVGGAIGV